MEKENAVSTKVLRTEDMMISATADYSHLPLEERVALFQRYSEAQAAQVPDDKLLNKELVVTDMTIYSRDFIDNDGMVGIANYVHFVLDSGEEFRTSSSQALPFAASVARFIGYDPKTGHLPHAITMTIKPQKAETGFIYRFVFNGLHSEKKAK